jgi:arylsulfatase A-like enzyme
VLLIVADDLRPQLAPYGRHTHTPHLVRLAAQGVTFDRAYAQVTVCNPSRVSFMTGRRPDAVKVGSA